MTIDKLNEAKRLQDEIREIDAILETWKSTGMNSRLIVKFSGSKDLSLFGNDLTVAVMSEVARYKESLKRKFKEL